MAGVSVVRKNLRRMRKFCCLSTDKASADLEAVSRAFVFVIQAYHAPGADRFCLLVCYMDIEGPVLAGYVDVQWSGRDTAHFLSALTVKIFEFEPHRCHPFYKRILGGSQNAHSFTI